MVNTELPIEQNHNPRWALFADVYIFRATKPPLRYRLEFETFLIGYQPVQRLARDCKGVGGDGESLLRFPAAIFSSWSSSCRPWIAPGRPGARWVRQFRSGLLMHVELVQVFCAFVVLIGIIQAGKSWKR